MRKRILYAGLLVGAALVPTSTALASTGDATTPTAAAATAVIDPPFRDDFTKLDLNNWRAIDRIADCYAPGGVTASGGLLHLTIKKGTTKACPTVNVRYNTYGRKDFGPGTVSARIKFVTAPGSWQTFWLTGASGKDFPANGEMDVAEIVGRDPTITHDALHSDYITGGGRRCDQGSKQLFPVDRQWHVYSVTWSSKEVTFKIDSKVMSVYHANGICRWPFGDRMRVQLSARTGKYGGTTDFSKYPLTYDVDWLTYQPTKK